MIPPPDFDWIAPCYIALERLTFGGLLHGCRIAHLDSLRDCRRALVLGDGDGRFVADLLRAHPAITVDSVDVSSGMLALARRRAEMIPGGLDRTRFIRSDVRSFPLPTAGYDLVVTNFFLDCFRPGELAEVIRRVAGACTAGALWVDGDFRTPPAGWARTTARLLLAGMYAFFALATRLRVRQLIDPAPLLAAEGFKLRDETARLYGFLSARLWSLGPQRPVTERHSAR